MWKHWNIICTFTVDACAPEVTKVGDALCRCRTVWSCKRYHYFKHPLLSMKLVAM